MITHNYYQYFQSIKQIKYIRGERLCREWGEVGMVTIVGVLELQCWDGIPSDFPLSLPRLGSICQEYPAPAHQTNKESINLWLKFVADELEPSCRSAPFVLSGRSSTSRPLSSSPQKWRPLLTVCPQCHVMKSWDQPFGKDPRVGARLR